MPEVLPTAKYLTATVLDPMFANWTFRFPAATPSATLPANFRAVVALLHASLLPDEESIAEIKDRNIRLSAGFLCERWCTSYRLWKVYHLIKGAMEEFEAPLTADGVPFVWPADIPGPKTKNNRLVANVNKVFLPMVSATMLHEVGHAIYRGTARTAQQIELRCDDFAMDYLLGTNTATGLIALFAIVCSKRWVELEIVEQNSTKGFDAQCYDHTLKRHIKVEFKKMLSQSGWNHPLKGLDLVVCWENRWPDFSGKVLELKKLLKEKQGVIEL